MNQSDKVSKYITYGEAVRSETSKRLGLTNEPAEAHVQAMIYIATKVFDPAREFVGGPLGINSFFRSAALNNAIPGTAKASQHSKGEAIDIDCDTYGHGTNGEVFKFIKENLEYDQLIWEYGNKHNPDWVHVSLIDESTHTRKNRKEVLRCFRDSEGNIRYIPFDIQL